MPISFNQNSVFNLKPINVEDVRKEVTGLLVKDESVVMAFKTIRDQLVFTNKRIISIYGCNIFSFSYSNTITS